MPSTTPSRYPKHHNDIQRVEDKLFGDFSNDFTSVENIASNRVLFLTVIDTFSYLFRGLWRRTATKTSDHDAVLKLLCISLGIVV